MSLLINALKKFRHESAPSLPLENSGLKQVTKLGKVAKIVLISSSAVALIAITAVASILIFKHMEKARIAKSMQGESAKIQKIQALMVGGQGGHAAEPSAEGKVDLRAQLQQKMQRGAAANIATSPASQPKASGLQAKPAEPGGAGFGKTKQRGGSAQSNVNSSAADTNSDSVNSTNPISDTASSDDSNVDDASADDASSEDTGAENASADDASSEDTGAEDASADDASSEDTGAEDASSDTASSSDPSLEETSSDVESVEDTSSDQRGTVSIQKVSSQIGANNPTYQQALNFTQLTQYDKAIPLLVNNDKLIIETQGLSALLLAKIYIMTSQYNLADDVLEHSTQLNAGSSVEVVALRAQSKFMQQQYQQAVNILAPQSPDLSSFPGYYALLAAAYMRLDQPSNAVSIFQQIVAKFPTSPNYWLGLALAYQKSGDVNSALIAYRRAAQLSESNPQVLLFINQQLRTLQAT